MTEIYQTETLYQGQFGQFTINQRDRIGVVLYRTALAISGFSFIIAASIAIAQIPSSLDLITPLYLVFCIGLGVSLVTIHIYFETLHRLLQISWLIGVISSIIIAIDSNEPLYLAIYHQPQYLVPIGFVFVSLTGIYFKEAFCFNRIETKLLTPLVPLLLLGHLFNLFSLEGKEVLLAIWSLLYLIFIIRKTIQPIPPDIGDKSVFEYLHQQKQHN